MGDDAALEFACCCTAAGLALLYEILVEYVAIAVNQDDYQRIIILPRSNVSL